MRWATARIQVSPEALRDHAEVRIERMMELQALVSDDSQIFVLKKGSDNPAPNICIGRAKRNDVVLEDSTISSLHAQMEVDDQEATLADQGSSNGTFVNCKRLGPGEWAVLQSGDCVRFGRRVYYYLNGERLLVFLELRIVKQFGAQKRRHSRPHS